MRRMFTLAASLAMPLASCATAQDVQPTEAAPAYEIVAENASISFPGTSIRGFRVGKDGSLLLDAGRKWYRAELWPPCDRDLRFEYQIGLVDPIGTTFDRFSRVIVDGRVCPVSKLDEIADPDADPDAASESAAPESP